MAVYSTEAALKSAILAKCCTAVNRAAEEAENIEREYVNKFYEVEPEYYIRTKQLRDSLTRNGVKPNGDGGCMAEVYFDSSKMHYPNGDTPIKKPLPNGREMGWSTWDGDTVLNAAMVGTGKRIWTNPTRIWTESVGTLKAEMPSVLERELKSAGLPIQ